MTLSVLENIGTQTTPRKPPAPCTVEINQMHQTDILCIKKPLFKSQIKKIVTQHVRKGTRSTDLYSLLVP